MDLRTIVSDLAPGDLEATSFCWEGLRRVRVASPEDPVFDLVYSKFWDEFGAQGEIETRPVLTDRLRWDPSSQFSQNPSGYGFLYEILAVLKDGTFVGARDHTAIVCHFPELGLAPEVVVHLSHALIDPLYRGQGLGGWLRAWPLQTARRALALAGLPIESSITLVAEMEPLDPQLKATRARLRSYERAGFLMVDPAQVDYLQPDFREPEKIDATGGPRPLPLRLVLRRVGREKETQMEGSELARMISALYQMYGKSFRPQDMSVVWKHLQASLQSKAQPEHTFIRLVKPLTGENS